MSRALGISATGMQAQQENVDRIANNIANANTTAFKKGRTDFQDLLYQTTKKAGDATSATTENPTGVQFGVGVKNASTSKTFTQGTLKQSEGMFDMAISGKGFFPVTMPDGQIAYTRDGSFRLNKDRQVVTTDEYPITPAITVPAETTKIQINPDGKVIAETNDGQLTELGQIQVVDFINPAGLEAFGNNLFRPTPAAGAPIQGVPGTNGLGGILQGMLEGSNVQAVTEMVDLISAQRAFEMNSKVMKTADEMLQNLVTNR